jgi:thioredoxin reductase (NADPH)
MPSERSPSIIDTRRDQMFPTLDPSEIERVRRFGKMRAFSPGEPIAKVGDVGCGLSVILYGEVDVTRHDPLGQPALMSTVGPGVFLGELTQLAGRPALADATARGPVEALIVPSDQLGALFIAEAELGERIMRALILGRVHLLETGAGGPVIVEWADNRDALRLQGFLRRNGHPHLRLDPEVDADAKALIKRFNVSPEELPIVLCPDGQLLRNPGVTELARCIGLVRPIDSPGPMTLRSWVPAPRALQPRSTPGQTDCAHWYSTPARSAGRRAPRHGSRTIWVSPPASVAWL